MSKIFENNKDKGFVVVIYSYRNDDIIYNVWPLNHYNFAYVFQAAYYEYMKKDEGFYISIIESDALNYLENAEAAYNDPTYYANLTQEAIEQCDIREWLKDFKRERLNDYNRI